MTPSTRRSRHSDTASTIGRVMAHRATPVGGGCCRLGRGRCCCGLRRELRSCCPDRRSGKTVPARGPQAGGSSRGRAAPRRAEDPATLRGAADPLPQRRRPAHGDRPDHRPGRPADPGSTRTCAGGPSPLSVGRCAPRTSGVEVAKQEPTADTGHQGWCRRVSALRPDLSGRLSPRAQPPPMPRSGCGELLSVDR
jgi:hypothetical protein